MLAATSQVQCEWCMPVTPATQEAEGGSQVPGQHQQLSETKKRKSWVCSSVVDNPWVLSTVPKTRKKNSQRN